MRRLLLAAITALALSASGSASAATFPPVMLCDPLSGNCATITSSGQLTGNGAIGSNGAASVVACDQSVTVNAAGANTQLVAAVAGKSVYVCSYAMSVSGTTAPTGALESGTGAVCATGSTAQTLQYPTGTFTIGSGTGTLARTAASGALCLFVAGTTPSVNVTVTYAQF
jgi:hypothetical protein